MKHRIKIIAPIGEVPEPDKDLIKRLKRLPKNASLSEIFREIGRWEKEAVIRFQKMEQTKKSGKIDVSYSIGLGNIEVI